MKTMVASVVTINKIIMISQYSCNQLQRSLTVVSPLLYVVGTQKNRLNEIKICLYKPVLLLYTVNVLEFYSLFIHW